MKEELINTLFNEFDKDKETIKKNLLLFMDTITLEANDDFRKIILNIKIEKNMARAVKVMKGLEE